MVGVTVYGTYYFSQRMTAFRNDYCMLCDAPEVAFQYRAFEIGHVFWIPILPKGFWKRWLCSNCGRDPHGQVASNGVKWVGIVLLALLTLSVWTTSPEKAGDSGTLWALRVGLPVAIVAIWRSIAKRRESTAKVRGIRPYSLTACPACGGSLARRGRGRFCSKCGAVQLDLGAA